MIRVNDNNFNPGALSLSGLTDVSVPVADVQAVVRRNEAERARYREKYGSSWLTVYCRDKGITVDYDRQMKLVNMAIYYGRCGRVSGTGPEIAEFPKRLERRARELYGAEYDTLWSHAVGDQRVIELLLADAVVTGKWQELPDELQAEYHRRVGGDV